MIVEPLKRLIAEALPENPCNSINPLKTLRLSEKFTFAISPETKQRIKKLPREVQLGAHLRAALDKILGELEET